MGKRVEFHKTCGSTDASGIFSVGHAPHMDDVIQEVMHARNGSVRLRKLVWRF